MTFLDKMTKEHIVMTDYILDKMTFLDRMTKEHIV